MTIWDFARRDHVFLRVVLIALVSSAGDVRAQAVADAPVSVTLSATTAPSVGQPGVTVISVTGNNFPSGTITPNLVNLTVTPASSGPPMSATASAVTTVVGSTRRITFQIAGPNLPSPTLYHVSVSGSTSAGQAFASANTANLTINPPAAILSLTPNSAASGQQLSVAISGQYTNFLNGSTTANFGAGISVGGAALGTFGPVTVNSATSATAQLTIDPGAVSGVNTVTVATGVQQASTTFTISPAQVPILTQVNPNTGQQGQQNLSVNITGQFTHFSQGTTTLSFGGGTSTNLILGGFDATRGGVPSLRDGALLAGLRSSIGAAFPSSVISASSTLTPAYLSTVNALLLSSSTGDTSATSALSAAEQAALKSFVLGGGTALVFVDNDTFAGGAPAVNNSFLAPFGLHITGTLGGGQSAIITNSTNPVIQGPFGIATGMDTLYPGWFDNVGTSTVLANLTANGQPALSVLMPSALAPGSGAVIFFSDSSLLGDGRRSANDMTLILNALALFGRGITVNSVAVTSPTALAAQISIAPNAILGPVTVTATTGAEVASLSNGFTVNAVTVGPSITGVSPNNGQQGATNLSVAITGQLTHFAQGTTLANFGAGIAVNSTTVADATHATANISILANAALGPRTVTVTTGTEVASLVGGFTVTAAAVNQPPIVSAGPNQTITLPSAEVQFTEYPAQIAGSFPREIVTGSDGNLWFTQSNVPGIGRITTAGVTTEFSVRADESITAGPDGNLWFVEYFGQKIGRITTGGVVTEFSLPNGGSYPVGITTGSDGNLWFTERFGNAIGRITPAGVITEFSVPTGGSAPTKITGGPDGSLWFTEQTGNKIGRITTAGVITEFPIPTGGSSPWGITTGPDGNLWFVEADGNKIGRITTAGVITEFPIATAGIGRAWITTGPDGNLWFTEDDGNKIGRITTAGVITEFPVPTPSSRPNGITTGPDGNLWFTEGNPNKIVKANFGVFPNPATTTLSGSVTDDGLPVGAVLSTTWSETSGPGPVSFGTPTATVPDVAGQANPVVTSATFSAPGTYSLSLAGSDSLLSSSSSVTITVNPPQIPTILSVNPNSGSRGQQNISVSVTGQFTHFVQGTTTANFGAGITVASLSVNSPTAATAVLNIDPAATAGPRRVTLTTGTEMATLGNGFTVVALGAVNQPPIVSAGQNQTITPPSDGFEGSAISPFWTVIGPGTATLTSTTAHSGSQSVREDLSSTFPWWAFLRHDFGAESFGSVSVWFKGQFCCGGAQAGLQIDSDPNTWVAVLEWDAVVNQFAARVNHGGTESRSFFSATLSDWHQFEIDSDAGGLTLKFDGTTVLTDPAIAKFRLVDLTTWSAPSGTGYFDDFSASIADTALNGTVADDGLPAGATLTTAWSLTSGPGPVAFGNPTATFPDVAGQANPVITSATFSTPGTYNLSLTGSDSLLSSSSSVTITVNPPQGPTILSANPNTGQQGQQNLSVNITGQFTHFVQGTTSANFGAGVTVNSTTVADATHATANISILPNAALGPRTVTITTGTEVASLPGGFSVTLIAVNQPPIVSAGPNQTITLSSVPVAITEYAVPTLVPPNGGPQGITSGPDGNLWFTENLGNKIGRITPAGGFMEFPIPGVACCSGSGGLGDIVAGPDGNLWFTEYFGSKIWRITTAGVFTPFPLAGGSRPVGITAGPDGNLWFTERFGNNIGRITTSGVITEFSIPTANSQPQEIAAGPDGNLWFVEYGNKIGRITVAGVVTEFAIPTSGAFPYGITAGPDGNLWFTETAGNKIGRITTAGLITEFPIPTANSEPAGITLGPDGNLWFAEQSTDVQPFAAKIGRITPTGAFTEFPLATGSSRPVGITVGPDCNVWFTEIGGNSVGRMIPGVVPVTTTLTGSMADDGLPAGSSLTGTWSASSGPAPVLFGTPTSTFPNIAGQMNPVTTSATFCRVGPYVVSLAGSDSLLSSSSSATITVSLPQAPAIIFVNPNTGQPGQSNLSVSITGQNTNFVQGTTAASFGAGITVVSVTVTSLTTATVVLNIDPAAVPGARNLILTTGAEVVNLINGFTVNGAALTQVNPNLGQQGQSNLSVAITGQFTHFIQGTTTASFGAGITVTTLTVISATTATAVLNIDPAATLGARTVTLTTGSEVASLANGFSVATVSATPSLTQVSPNSGQQGRSGPVGIVGLNTHFVQGTTQLDFGPGITVSNISVTCATCLTAQIALAANAPVGPRTVTATTGSEVAQLANGFTVLAGTPILTSMVPASGRQGQSVTSTITGQFTNWVQGTTTVNLGAGIAVNTVTVTNPTTLTVQLTVAPNAALGIRNLTVTTGAEVVSATNVFNVLAGLPAITQANPNVGQQGQANLAVSITGQFTNFVQGTTQLNFGAGITVNSVTVANATSLTANISIALAAAAGARTITATTGTEVASLANGFTVTSAGAVILSVSPNTGQQGQSGPVTITGQATHFVQGITQVNFGTGITVSSVTVTNATTLTAQIALANNVPVGGRTVTVSTGAEIVSLANGFTVQSGTPFISVINPGSGQQGQSLPVVITGQFTNFVQGTTTVDFGAGITVNSVTVADATDLTAQVSIAANATLGQRTVTVTTGAEVESATNAFGVSAASLTPVLSIVNPNTGQDGQTNLGIAITGLNTHFVQGTSQASFGGGGVTVNSITVTDSTHLSANISIAANAAAAVHNVTVTTGAEIAALANAFTVKPATNQPPVITIAPTWSVTLPNRLTLTYTVTDDGLPLSGALTVSWDTITTPSGATVGYQNQTPTSISAGFSDPGTYTLRITATDTQYTVTQDVTVTVNSGGGGPGPTVSITSPVDGAEVTAAVNVIGSVNSSFLSNWVLEFEGPGDTAFRTLATGTTTVANGTLGTFDPSVLLNGIAYIRLTATDTSNQSTSTGPISLTLTRNQKIGNFTVSFNDLSVPVAGLPIQIVRTYDSRRRGNPGTAFSYGWTLDINTVTASESVTAGDLWNETSTGGAFPTYSLQPTKPHVITVSLPDGTTYSYDVTLTPSRQQLAPIDQVAIGFTARPGTIASLAVLGSNVAFVEGAVPGPVQLFDDTLSNVFDTLKYRLTLPDGRMLDVDPTTGLEKMTDLNGNTLTVTSAGIIHSSGKSVTFTRDVAQRITKITDPAGNSINYAYSNLTGDLTSVTDRSNQTTTFTYDSTHGLLTIKDPRGVQPIRNVYDNSGRLIQHIDAFGNTINYTHNLNTHQEIVADRLNNVTVNEYDADGNVVKVTDALGGITQRTYDSRDNLLSETNALGSTRTYTYDAKNNRLTETDPLGKTTTYTYNSRNQVLTITDALSHVTTNTYDAKGNLTSTADPAGNTTTHVYNASGLQTSMTDALGGVTSYQYDASGNLTQQTDALSHVTTFTYDANGNRLTQTKTRTTTSGPETLLMSYQYDASNRLTQTTYPDGSIAQIQYNAIAKQSVTIDPLGRQTSYQYDLMGRLTQTTFPDSTTESATYDAEGDRVTSTDRAGRTTAYVYDPLKRVVKTTAPDGAFVTTTYDAIGQVISATDARGNVTQHAYDAAGRRTQVTDALSHVTSFAYDFVGNQISLTDANSHTTQYQYDSLNRRIKTTYPDLTTDTVGYDALGRTVSKTDQAGKTTQFQYDKLGHLTQVTDALSQLTQYAYDEVGSRISQTDANNHTTTFAYDKLGRRTKRTLPLGMSETSAYDLAGNLTSKTDFNGKITTYTYDAVNRLVTKLPDVSFGAPTISFSYTGTGQRQMMIDPSGTTTYAYDLRDRLTQKGTPQGTLSYTYDLAGNLGTIRSSNANGTSVDYAYDSLNRLSSAKDNRLASGTTTYAYDNAGNLQGYLYPNGVQTGYAYNSLNRLTNVQLTKGGTLASYAYALGAAGNRTQVTELGGRQVNYTYDALYRLTSETIAGGAVNGAIGYQYDPVGNRQQRTSTVAPVPAATYSYDVNDRLTTDTYDLDGNTTASGGSTYTYDFENHLINQNSGTVAIVYDGDGNRVSKTVAGVTTKYLVDDRNLTGYAQVLEEITSGVVQRVYTYGLNRISQSQASGTSFYGYDGHGSVRLLTDTTGAVTDRYDYDAFGNVLSQAGTTPNVYLYSGEQLDPNIGFYYLRARYYVAQSGRFSTADEYFGSVFDPQTLHRYSYAQANPVNNADPSGRLTLAEAVTISAVVGVLSGITTYAVTGSVPKALTVAVVATAATFFFAAPSPVLLSAASASGIFRVGPFILTAEQLEHIFERHSFIEGFLNGASYFYPGEEVLSLIKAADKVAPLVRGGSFLVYIVDAGTTIGFDAYQMGPTVYYTVVTDAIGEVITMYPGIPTRLIFP